MNSQTLDCVATPEKETTLQLATFYVDDLLLGMEIDLVQEINRHMDITEIPDAPPTLRGVINLLGDVVTIADMRPILGLPRTEIGPSNRNVVIQSQDEQIALLVDRIADIVSIKSSNIEPAPANVDGVDGRFFRGVCTMQDSILVLLDVDEALDAV